MTSLALSLFRLFVESVPPNRHLPSFPTRRSSDLLEFGAARTADDALPAGSDLPESIPDQYSERSGLESLDLQDRKSTRLNSSHRTISYAVFCLKKKNRGLTIHSTDDIYPFHAHHH